MRTRDSRLAKIMRPREKTCVPIRVILRFRELWITIHIYFNKICWIFFLGRIDQGRNDQGRNDLGPNAAGVKPRWGETSRGRTGSGAKRPGFLGQSLRMKNNWEYPPPLGFVHQFKPIPVKCTKVGFCPSGLLSQWAFVQWAFVLVGFCPSGLLS